MRYEVQKQVDEIDKALGVITMYSIPNMNITKEELEEALKKAESSMKLMMKILSRNDITMKEVNESICGKHLSNKDVDFDNR